MNIHPILGLLLPIVMMIAPSSAAQKSRSTNAAASQSFPKFYAAFRAAVSKRDRAALKAMMSSPFNENCTVEGPPDTPDSGIAGLDRRGWNSLQKLLALGTKPWPGKGRPRRVTRGDPENLQLFEFGADGRWRWLGCACYEC
jgi:hypothetical protein